MGVLLISQMMWSVSHRGTFTELIPLGMRRGYSAHEAASFLHDIGPSGRVFYLAMELVDLTVYLLGYRAALLILSNNLSAAVVEHYSNLGFVRYSALIVLAIAVTDVLETLGHILLTLIYDDGIFDEVTMAAGWTHLCLFSSTFNRIKWILGLAYLITLLGLTVIYAGKILFQKGVDEDDDLNKQKKD